MSTVRSTQLPPPFSNFKTLETPHYTDSRIDQQDPRMALKDPQFRSSGDPMEGSDAEELEELEADVKEMAQKVRHYRTTLPDQLKATFTSILSSQRPPFLEFVSGSEPEASGEPNPGQFRGYWFPHPFFFFFSVFRFLFGC